MTVDPIAFLFNYELGSLKPEPPKPKKPRPSKKVKKERPPRDYAAERARREERLRLLREEEAALAAKQPQPEYLPRTRGEAARLAEAGIVDGAVRVVDQALEKGDAAVEDVAVARRKRLRRDTGPVVVVPTTVAQPVQDLSLVETVSKEQSFKHFNDGWIFSPTARRGSIGRAGTSNEPPTPTNPVTSTSRLVQNKSSIKDKRKQRTTVSKKGKSSSMKKTSTAAIGASTARNVARDLTASELSELSDISDEEEGSEEEGVENTEDFLGAPVPPDTEPEGEGSVRDEGPEADAVRHLKIKPGKTLEGGTLGTSNPIFDDHFFLSS
jgi:hypothetical protein